MGCGGKAAEEVPMVLRIRDVALVLSALALIALVSPTPAQAACAAAWNCNNTYTGGQQVSYGGSNYTMCAGCTRSAGTMCSYPPPNDNWWTNNGACSGSTATATATPTRTATPTTGGSTATATRTNAPTATATSSGSG